MLIVHPIPGGYRLIYRKTSPWGDMRHPFTREELEWFRHPIGGGR